MGFANIQHLSLETCTTWSLYSAAYNRVNLNDVPLLGKHSSLSSSLELQGAFDKRLVTVIYLSFLLDFW